jgi:Cof subfamily protein (haloacid dehalogenase superfamily)
MEKHDIKLIALDLDGTTLDSKRGLTERAKRALEAAIKKGVYVIIATGRAYSALPEDVFKIEGIKYILTSNGASVMDISENKSVYSNCIDAAALENTVSLLRQYDFMMEFFIKGHAYVDQAIYDKVNTMEFTEPHKSYIINTRKPVEALLDFALLHKELIENINVNFENQNDRSMMREVLAKLENVTLTTSFDHNLEIGGATTSKADAIRMLCNELGISEAQVMACGDSPNDMAMLKAAGFPVAMGNAKDELKEIAKYITSTNDEDGVAKVIEKFVL